MWSKRSTQTSTSDEKAQPGCAGGPRAAYAVTLACLLLAIAAGCGGNDKAARQKGGLAGSQPRDLIPQQWTLAKGQGRRVRLLFSGAPEVTPKYVKIDSVGDTLELTLYVHAPPGPRSLVLSTRCVEFVLAENMGGRNLVDGARDLPGALRSVGPSFPSIPESLPCRSVPTRKSGRRTS
jgi:hypothetical protein